MGVRAGGIVFSLKSLAVFENHGTEGLARWVVWVGLSVRLMDPGWMLVLLLGSGWLVWVRVWPGGLMVVVVMVWWRW